MKKKTGAAFVGGALLVVILGWFGLGPGLGGGGTGVTPDSQQTQQEPQQQDQQGNVEMAAIVVNGETITFNGNQTDLDSLSYELTQLSPDATVTLEDQGAIKAVFEEVEALLIDGGFNYTLMEAQ